LNNNLNKIKICHFTNIITGKSDGVYSHLKMIFRYVDREKFQQYLVFQGNPQIEAEVSKLGVKVIAINSLNKRFSIRSFREFYSIAKSENVDIIHTHFLKPYSIAGLLNIFLKKKLIFNYHGLFIENKYNTHFEKFIYRKVHTLINHMNVVDLAIVPSYASRQILMDETDKFGSVKVYYNGYDNLNNNDPEPELINYFEALKSSHFVIGIIARIDIQKRIDLALEIANKVISVNKEAYFVFLGDGVLKYEMTKKMNEMHLGKNVKMIGYIPNAKLYIKYFDLILYTSDWEGLPLSIWEAMAAGVPIVSRDVGGIKEVIEKENCGIVYPKDDIDGGIKIIIKLLSDKNQCLRMGTNGIKAIKEKYNSKAFAIFFNNLYYNLMQK
jgi:L-malate glycosyltransferase